MFFFFNDTATTEIYTLSLHDALPILQAMRCPPPAMVPWQACSTGACNHTLLARPTRSEEHTSELQSQSNLVCRLLLEKKKIIESAQVLPPRHGPQQRDRAIAGAVPLR